MFEHNVYKIILIFLALAVYTLMVAFNAIAGAGLKRNIFLQSVGNISNKYNTEFTPAGWTFTLIWNVIFFWQFLWFGYVLSGLCRRSELGWMYLKPNVFPVPFYLVWILNNVFNIGWLFLWDREYLIPALVFLGAIPFTNYIVLFISYRSLYLNGDWLQTQHKVDLWLIRILAQNGIAFYTTWTTIACLLNFSVCLTYNGGITSSTSVTVALAILAFEMVLWFCLENFLFDKYVRYTVTVYPIVILALSGALDKNFITSDPGQNGIFTAVLLAVACAAFALRLVLVIWKHVKYPLYESMSNKSSIPLS
ncbi:hypothetical protein XENTR_v10013503 [Xenopus tropicalis]|uniref:Uncharacterized protein LOC100491791 n=1 Tax=Xenopus tropicalis TaxID=8364 RepID=A0A8J0QZP8_XENTR|nr:uncharacterized protein LOC100491791 [Xenopus tropicalis]XP_004914766.1 uncharacterized protein LOC100491791 [Xenopus tropicalis]KAE8601027.1 hypothetical protein XENTR_v10013503 [Xenopus tropicalis]KAE8601028.1 hypothetical protein XENTR_v10013503 [Xenopus tropicalis]KAE8601029.1 hypothetical protein XENTR_v10013503 [Xenopus tropicalis]|eukprot:XP_002939364.2 PREDICTED: uncharacterized protein LOC100491791 [Xenopus tropicalis]